MGQKNDCTGALLKGSDAAEGLFVLGVGRVYRGLRACAR